MLPFGRVEVLWACKPLAELRAGRLDCFPNFDIFTCSDASLAPDTITTVCIIPHDSKTGTIFDQCRELQRRRTSYVHWIIRIIVILYPVDGPVVGPDDSPACLKYERQKKIPGMLHLVVITDDRMRNI